MTVKFLVDELGYTIRCDEFLHKQMPDFLYKFIWETLKQNTILWKPKRDPVLQILVWII